MRMGRRRSNWRASSCGGSGGGEGEEEADRAATGLDADEAVSKAVAEATNVSEEDVSSDIFSYATPPWAAKPAASTSIMLADAEQSRCSQWELELVAD